MSHQACTKMVLYMADTVKKYGIRSKKIGRIYTYIQKSCRLLPHFNKELKVNMASPPALSKRLSQLGS